MTRASMKPSKVPFLHLPVYFLLLACLIATTVVPALAQTIQTVHSFVSAGAFPNGRIIQGTDGLLYGTTVAGGGPGGGPTLCGAKDGSNFSQLKAFDCRVEGDGGCLRH